MEETVSDTKQETCEERIEAHQEGREEDFATLFAIASDTTTECPACAGTGYRVDSEGDDEDCPSCGGTGEKLPEYAGEQIDADQASERLGEYPLGLSVRRVMRVDLSTGGPGDWLEAELDDDGEVIAVDYHFNDWFDHAERRVHQGDALWQAAEYYAEYLPES